MGVSVITGPYWLHEHGTPSSVRWSSKAIGGCYEAAFEIDPEQLPPGVAKGTPIQLKSGMSNAWRGQVHEISDTGTVTCIGPWSVAGEIAAMDALGSGTLVPDVALTSAISRGAITWRMPTGGVSAAAIADGTGGEGLLLTEMLESWALQNGALVGVDANGDLYAGAPPATPHWVVSPHAGARLTVTGDYVSHLWGDYINTAGVWARVGPIIDQAAADAWGRREATADLSELGQIDSTRATNVVTAMLVNGGARKSVTGTLRLSRQQLMTPGGEPAALSMVNGGQRVRLLGVGDGTNAAMRTLYTDIIIDQCAFTEGEDEIAFEPMGGPEVNLGDVLTEKAKR